MDLETLIIGLVFLALLVVPFVYAHRKQKKKTRAFVNEYLALAGQNQLTLSKYDTLSQKYAIGISEAQKKLFYIHKEEQLVQTALIDLEEIKSCTVAKESRESNGNKVIEYIGLHLVLRSSRPAEKDLEFYNEKKALQLTGELQLAEKWRVIISNSLAAQQVALPQ